MPKEIIKRPKRGFAVNVVDDWFNDSINGKMNDFFHDSKSLMYDFLRPQAAQKLYSEHVSGKHDNHKILFSLAVFEEWLRLNYRN